MTGPMRAWTGAVDTATLDGATVITYAAVPQRHVITGVAWSYDAAPAGGHLTITDGGVTIFQVAITAGGPGFFMFPYPKMGTANSAMVITLADPGGQIVGCLNVLNHWVE